MERIRHYRIIRFFENFYFWTRKLQTTNPKTTSGTQKIKIIQGMTALLVSAFLGFLTFTATEIAGIEKYRNQNWPHPEVWQTLLQNKGFIMSDEIGKFSKVLSTHPDAFSEQSLVWVSSAPLLVYISHSPYQKNKPEIWFRKSLNENRRILTPIEWRLLGSGEVGFHALLDFLNRFSLKSEPKSSSTRKSIDPMEIRY